jgi:Bacteriophage Sf6, terminase small subunit-like
LRPATGKPSKSAATPSPTRLPIVDDRRNDWIVQQREDGTTEKILDPERVNRARLRIQARHWLVSKLLPKKFGDRPEPKAPQDGNAAAAEMMKVLNGRTRGLPSEDEPLDDE